MTTRRRATTTPSYALGTGRSGGRDADAWRFLSSVAVEGRKSSTDTSPALLALSEREFQRIVRAALEVRGFVVWSFPEMRMTTAGVPDLICWHERLPGLLVVLELKRERGARTTPAQTAALAHLATVPGVDARILRPSGWPALRDWIDSVMQETMR